jgi:protein ImuB
MQRRWQHQLWYEGPLDQKFPPQSASTSQPDSNGDLDNSIRDRARFARQKLFMPDRGICMTPSIRASGPSYMKPIPAPVQRPKIVEQLSEPPLVITRTVASRQIVVAASNAAAACGVRADLTLTEARALCPGLKNFDEDPTADARALQALARWMMRFTPSVALSTQSSALSTLFLDITGCDRALGGVSTIVQNVIESLRRLRLSAGVAVAPTPGAAWALASFGDNGRIITLDDLPSVLSTLPVAALMLDDDLLQSLHHLGLETIGHVMGLPRSAMPSRFGDELLHRLDQALGQIDEPLVPLTYQAPIEARMDFDGVVDSLETIYLVFKRLIGEVVTELSRRGCGARTIDIEFFRAYAQTIRHSIGLSRPSRDPVNLFNLIRCAIENIDGGGDGFLGIRLFVPAFERVSDEQIALLDHERYAGEIELQQLIERLCVKLGEEAVAIPFLAESHLPERAFEFQWHGRLAHAETTARARRPCHVDTFRPLQLLAEPIEIAAVVSPSEDRDGRPILFRRNNEVHELTHAIGPDRISGEWWRGHDRTRDYFDVEDEAGKRFWLFRVQETNRWYLHGMF